MTDAKSKKLVDRIKADRLDRKMTWKPYALFLGIKFPTLMKIIRNVTVNPSELTVSQIEERIALPKTRKEAYRGADVTKATTTTTAGTATAATGMPDLSDL